MVTREIIVTREDMVTRETIVNREFLFTKEDMVTRETIVTREDMVPKEVMEATGTSYTEATVTTTTRDMGTETSKVTVTRVDTEVTSNKGDSRGQDSVEARRAVEDSEISKEAGVTNKTETTQINNEKKIFGE